MPEPFVLKDKDKMLTSLDFWDGNNWYAMALDLNSKKKGTDICWVIL